jgi:hypothetical protein
MEMVFLLRIPPASLKNLAKYTQTLAGHGVDLPDAVTRLEFESQGILKFTPMGYVDEATAAATDKAIAAKATDQLEAGTIGRGEALGTRRRSPTPKHRLRRLPHRRRPLPSPWLPRRLPLRRLYKAQSPLLVFGRKKRLQLLMVRRR